MVAVKEYIRMDLLDHTTINIEYHQTIPASSHNMQNGGGRRETGDDGEGTCVCTGGAPGVCVRVMATVMVVAAREQWQERVAVVTMAVRGQAWVHVRATVRTRAETFTHRHVCWE